MSGGLSVTVDPDSNDNNVNGPYSGSHSIEAPVCEDEIVNKNGWNSKGIAVCSKISHIY